MKLAYSTLGCPGRSWPEAIELAVEFELDGIEWRLVDGGFVTPDFPLALAREIGAATVAAGLHVPAVDSSLELALPPGDERAAVLRDTVATLHVARGFGARWLRVFAGPVDGATPTATAVGWLRDVLDALGPHVAETGVGLAIETHSIGGGHTDVRSDGVTCSRFLRDVFAAGVHMDCGVQWDLGNTLMEGELPATTWANLHPFVTYLQVKDMQCPVDGAWVNVAPGSGVVPIRDIVGRLAGAGFVGWLSFEWEKWWHPELAALESVLPGYVDLMRSVLHDLRRP